MSNTQNIDIPADELDALGLLQSIYRSPGVSLATRMRAAIAALPFERPKLAVVATTTSEDLVDRLQRAQEASMKVINSRPVQVLEAPKAATVDEVPDHSGPFAVDNKSRFRRF
jgi:hypothetical protein